MVLASQSMYNTSRLGVLVLLISNSQSRIAQSCQIDQIEFCSIHHYVSAILSSKGLN